MVCDTGDMSEWEPTRPQPPLPEPGGAGEPPAGGAPPPDSLAFDPVEPEPAPWYRQRGPLTAAIATGVAVLFLLVAFLVWAFTGDDDNLATRPPGTTVLITVPPTEPLVTEPPVTQPPVTQPPVTQPPVTQPAVTEPPVTRPPATAPPPPPTTEPIATTSIPVVTVPPSPEATVWDVISASPDLSRLRDLLIFAELDDVIDGPEPFTLFAPGNDAWDLLEASPGGPDLLADQGRVADLLLRHVVFAETYSSDELFETDVVLVANGDVLVINPDDETVDGAELLVPDIDGSNGVLHVVQRVLLP
jgi:uncharacterized surface protein with fasciclin (FAS1) repeats